MTDIKQPPAGAWVVISRCDCYAPQLEAVCATELDALRLAHDNRSMAWEAHYVPFGEEVDL